jgi:CRP-like cAMP-binding protein
MPESEVNIRELRDSLKKCVLEQVKIPSGTLTDIVSRFKPLKIEAGNHFTKPGQVCKEMAYIQDGVMRMYNYVDGDEITLWIGSKNRFITDLSSFIHQRSARWFIEAVEPSILLTITREDHYQLISNYHEWIEFDNRLLTSAYTIIEERMFSHLHMSAEERFKMLLETEPELFNKVPLKQIASMLAMTPETLSRLRAKQTS